MREGKDGTRYRPEDLRANRLCDPEVRIQEPRRHRQKPSADLWARCQRSHALDRTRPPDLGSKRIRRFWRMGGDTASRSKKSEAFIAKVCSPAASISKNRTAIQCPSESPEQMPSARRSSICTVGKKHCMGLPSAHRHDPCRDQDQHDASGFGLPAACMFPGAI